ncbi:MAG: hypothetical protein NVS9B15_12220 [Acidobacteriaceae bacterium]
MANEDLLQTWRERLEDFAHSEMTAQDWCDFNRLPLHQYYYWRRKLLRIDGAASSTPAPSPSWMPVDLRDPAASADASSRITLRVALGVTGAEIDVRSGFCPSLLRAVVEALG